MSRKNAGNRQASERSLWDHAITVTLAAAILSGLGYLAKQFLDRDRSDLGVSVDSPSQVIPVLRELPVLAGDTVYCEVVRFGLVLSHNQKGKRPIRVTRVTLEWEQLPISPERKRVLNCQVDVLRLQPHGIVQLRQYILVLRGTQAEGRYLRSRRAGDTVTVDPGNILRSTEATEAVTLSPEGEDAHFQSTFVIEAASSGLYRARIATAYDIGGLLGTKRTPWVYLYLAEEQ